MAIEVLLMANVEDLGAEGDMVKVSEGYARNFLIPRKLAAPVTEATRRRLAKLQKERALSRQVEIDKSRVQAEALAKGSYTIPVKVGEGEKLYGSVTAADIAAVLQANGFQVGKEQVVLEEPLKALGVYDIPIRLHAAVETTIKLWIVEE
jgi:large subunit ribosomal protein L9